MHKYFNGIPLTFKLNLTWVPNTNWSGLFVSENRKELLSLLCFPVNKQKNETSDVGFTCPFLLFLFKQIQ